MIIQSSTLGMESVRRYSSVSMDAANISVNGGTSGGFLDALKLQGKRPETATEETDKTNDKSDNEGETTTNDMTSSLKNSYDEMMERFKSMRTNKTSSERSMEETLNHIRVQCIHYLFMLLFHRDITDDSDNITNFSDYLKDASAEGSTGITMISLSTTQTNIHYHYESEETSFSVEGTVICQDGSERSFNLDFSMSREFEEYYEESINLTTFCDPLVINLDSNIAEVSDQKIRFDLDCDGVEEEVSRLNSSSGYLALDLNDDGIINDGSELFGTKSGNGFKDLAAYDEDHNGFIDEGDDIFDKLKIYIQNEDGSQTLFSLKDKDIGAICLSSVTSDFSLNDVNTNEANARIRRTGIFLYESGTVGSIQQLDLAQ